VSSKGGYARGVLVSVVAVAGMSLMALANSIVLARVAGPEGRGLYGLAVAMGALTLPIASAGLGSAMTWQLGREQSYAQLLGLTRRAVLVSLVLGALTAGVAMAGLELSLDEAAMWALLAAGLTLPAQVTVELGRGLLLGQRRAVAYNLSSVAVIAVLLGLNLSWRPAAPDWLATDSALANSTWVLGNLVLASWIIAALMVAKSLRQPSERPAPELVRGSLRYGKHSAVVALGDAALLRVDYLVAAPFVDLAALGIYAIADQISHLMSWVGLLAGKMMLPEAASDDAGGQRSLAKLALACRLIVAITLVGSVIAIGLGRWLIAALFGPEFTDAWWGLLLLLPATLCKSLHALIATWLQGRGDQEPIVRASAISVAVEVVAVFGLAIAFGWLGVAAAKTGAYAVQFALGLAALRRHRAQLPGADESGDDGHSIPGGRWLITRSDVTMLWQWLAARKARRSEKASKD
jgi:O-antigen/teichoic acid export membrane protein